MLFSKCSKDNSEKNDSDFYSTDTAKLGIEVTDSDIGLKFSPPQNWILMPSSMSKKIESRSGMPSSPDNFIYTPVYVFFNNSSGGVLSVGKVISSDSTLSKQAQMNYYKSLLSSKYQKNDLSFGKFTKSKISFFRFNFKKENLISIKLLFENSQKDIIQMEFSIPSTNLDKSKSLIKASIGSIKLN
jgi:hypothetical protein